MNDNTRSSEHQLIQTLALAAQGMAVWHLALGLAALVVTVALIVPEPSAPDHDVLGMAALGGAEVAGGALAAALILGGLSWAILGRDFWRPRWGIILVPGLAGTLVTWLFDIIGWPASFLFGGTVAFFLVVRLLEQAERAESLDA